MLAARPPASLIYNPHAGRRRHSIALQAISDALNARYDLRVTPTTQPTEAIALAAESARRGDAVAFAWGGDGTVREVVEGLLDSETALGVLPGGTVNVVALAIGLSKDPAEAARTLAAAAPQPRDVGLIGPTPFLMQATAGLDAFFMHEVSVEMKARYGFAGIVLDALRIFPRYRFHAFTVEVDGKPYQVTGAGFVNMAEYAGPYPFVPGARWDDGKGHVLLYTGRSHLSALMFAISLPRRSPPAARCPDSGCGVDDDSRAARTLHPG